MSKCKYKDGLHLYRPSVDKFKKVYKKGYWREVLLCCGQPITDWMKDE